MSIFKRKKKNNAQNTDHSQAAENETAKATNASKAKQPPAAQKRNHFRLDCHIPATTKVMKKNDLNQIALSDPLTSLVSNLSSGGAKVLLNADLGNGERILISLKLDDDPIVLTGEIKFKTESFNPEYVYEYGVMFTGASRKDQDTIAKYLFKEQMQSFL